MSSPYFYESEICGVCGRTNDVGTGCRCLYEAKRYARPALEAPPAGTCCPLCAEPLVLEDWCRCGWRGGVEAW